MHLLVLVFRVASSHPCHTAKLPTALEQNEGRRATVVCCIPAWKQRLHRVLEAALELHCIACPMPCRELPNTQTSSGVAPGSAQHALVYISKSGSPQCSNRLIRFASWLRVLRSFLTSMPLTIVARNDTAYSYPCTAEGHSRSAARTEAEMPRFLPCICSVNGRVG